MFLNIQICTTRPYCRPMSVVLHDNADQFFFNSIVHIICVDFYFSLFLSEFCRIKLVIICNAQDYFFSVDKENELVFLDKLQNRSVQFSVSDTPLLIAATQMFTYDQSSRNISVRPMLAYPVQRSESLNLIRPKI